MALYIYLFLYCCLIGLLNSRTNSSIPIIFILLPMILVMGLRGSEVGIDTAQYIYNYKKVLLGSYDKSILFNFLSHVSHFLGMNENGVFVLFAIITLLPLFYVVHKLNSSVLLAVLILFSMGLYLRYFNIMVQGAAVSLFFLAFFFRSHGKNMKATIFFTLAVLTHLSAILILPFLFVSKLRGVVFGIIILWFFSLIFIFFPDALSATLGVMILVTPSAYSSYLTSSSILTDGFFSLSNIIPQFLFMFVWFAYYKSREMYNTFFSNYLLMFLFGVVIMNFLNAAIFFNRIQLYLTIFGIVAIPYSVNYFFSGKQKNFVIGMFFIFFSSLFLYRLYRDPYMITPYSFFW